MLDDEDANTGCDQHDADAAHISRAGCGAAAGPNPGAEHIDEGKPSPSKQRPYRSVADIGVKEGPSVADAHVVADSKPRKKEQLKQPSDRGDIETDDVDDRPSAQHSEPAVGRDGHPLSDNEDCSQLKIAGRRSSAGAAPGRAVVQSGVSRVLAC